MRGFRDAVTNYERHLFLPVVIDLMWWVFAVSRCAADASAALQVRALKDYCNNYDLTSLNIKAGDVITVTHTHKHTQWPVSVFFSVIFLYFSSQFYFFNEDLPNDCSEGIDVQPELINQFMLYLNLHA